MTGPATTHPVMLPDLLHQRQIDSIAWSTEKVNIWEGSIRAGKTVASLIRFLMFLADAPEQGELLVVGKTLQSVFRNLFAPLYDPELFGFLSRSIDYTQGSPLAQIMGRRVHVLGANDAKAESKLRGMTLAGAYVDELTLLPRDFFMTLQGRASVPGSKIFATTNPDTPAHWVRKDILLSGSPNVRNFHFRIDDNTFLDPEYVRWIKATYRGLYYRRNILGQWVVAEGAVYDMWDPRRHVVDIMPAIQEWLAVTIDYGTMNPFHALLIGIGADKNLYVAAEWRYDGRGSMAQMTDGQYADALLRWLDKLRKSGGRFATMDQPRFWIVDPSAASFRTELRSRGMIQAQANNDVLDGIRLTSDLIARGKLKIHRSCHWLIDEITGYSWDDKAALLGEDKPVKVDDHGPDALRYGIRTTQNLWTPFVEAA
jgi:PBSX family phage terminase large subunit